MAATGGDRAPAPAAALAPPSSSQSSSQPQPLSFPPALFARLAPADFLHASLTSSAAGARRRPNGRAPAEVRRPGINAGSLANADGSAVVRLGATTAVCGVRAELLPAAGVHGGLPADLAAWQSAATEARRRGGAGGDSDGGGGRGWAARPEGGEGEGGGIRPDADIIADLRLLVPNLELSTGCDPAHLPGNAPGAEAQGLTQRIAALLKTCDLVGLASLLVWYEKPLSADGETTTAAGNPNDPDTMTDEDDNESLHPEMEVKALWTLYIDILYISLDGAAFDAAWLAVLAALRNTLLPKARWDEDQEMLLCSPLREDASPLELRPLPVPLGASIFTHSTENGSESFVLYDADSFEESVCQGQLAIVITKKADSKGKSSAKGTKLVRIEAHGKGVGLASMSELAKAAESRWKEWQSALDWNG